MGYLFSINLNTTVIIMQGICEERPQGLDQVNLAEALARKRDFVSASNIIASLTLSRLSTRQLLRAGEIHFRAGLATKSRINFRDAVTVFKHARKLEGESTDVCCWLARAYGYLALYSWIPNKIRFATRSKRYAEKALRIDPGHALSAFVLGIWHQNMPAWLGGNQSLVQGYLDQAVQGDCNSIMFRIARVRWNIKQGRFAQAYADLLVMTKLPAINPDDIRRRIEAIELLDTYFPSGDTQVAGDRHLDNKGDLP